MTNYLGRPKAEDLRVLKDLIEAGAVTPVIGASYPLSDVPDAIRELGRGARTRQGRRHGVRSAVIHTYGVGRREASH